MIFIFDTFNLYCSPKGISTCCEWTMIMVKKQTQNKYKEKQQKQSTNNNGKQHKIYEVSKDTTPSKQVSYHTLMTHLAKL